MGVNFFNRDDRDIKFVLLEQMGIEKILQYPAYKDFTAEDVSMMVDEAIKVGREVLGPHLQDGDREGCRWDDGEVTTPASWKKCWQVLFENGWSAATSNPEFGGQGLPMLVGGMLREIFSGANLAFMTFPGLSVGNGRLIERFGTDSDRALFVEKMYTGQWAGTMCLTEPDAGSDVGALRTKAAPDPGSNDPRIYKITGTKRFISCGQHDLADNIIHLLLARIQGAPGGTKGLSLFVVPKIWVNPDGSLGEANDVYCEGIEEKMGIHGSPTTTLAFGENGGCRGILLGEPHSGMAMMFEMMNHARISCGISALGVAASAYEMALSYAKERVQGHLLTDMAGPAVRIIEHPDVRRMLMRMKSGVEAMRAFVAQLLLYQDQAEHDPDEKVRNLARARIELLTPMIKAYPTDFAFDLIIDGIQVLGGAGYCSDFPLEQYARDVKILSIWEGTNHIQSLDLACRKLNMARGRVFNEWLAELMTFVAEHQDHGELAKEFALLDKAGKIIGEFVRRLGSYFQENRITLVPLYSTRFLECFSETYMASLMLKQALLALEKLAGIDADSSAGVFYRGKVAAARFFCRNTLTNVFSRHMSLLQEDTSALDIPEAGL